MSRSGRILVVDDEPSLRNVARRLITRLGHDCETVGTSAEVAEVVATRDFDLVLCDYRLATETADEVLATLDAKAAQLIHRTVLATGAMTDSGVMALRERYGLSVVAKPYGIEELRQILATAAGVAAR